MFKYYLIFSSNKNKLYNKLLKKDFHHVILCIVNIELNIVQEIAKNYIKTIANVYDWNKYKEYLKVKNINIIHEIKINTIKLKNKNISLLSYIKDILISFRIVFGSKIIFNYNLLSCVEITMSFLNIKNYRILTPYSLYKYLLKNKLIIKTINLKE